VGAEGGGFFRNGGGQWELANSVRQVVIAGKGKAGEQRSGSIVFCLDQGGSGAGGKLSFWRKRREKVGGETESHSNSSYSGGVLGGNIPLKNKD